jgi:hypothetical protein
MWKHIWVMVLLGLIVTGLAMAGDAPKGPAATAPGGKAPAGKLSATPAAPAAPAIPATPAAPPAPAASAEGVMAPPAGFAALFDGKNLDGLKGLVGDPESRAKMTAEDLAKAQAQADDEMRAHWRADSGVLCFDGKGQSICTKKDYADFEMLVDWKIEPGGDSGVYVRGSPQVQIWDISQHPEGSGGLYNNQKNPSKPLKCADKPAGEWNRFRIRMVGDKVTVHLNDVLIVDNVTLENYWKREKPIYPIGQIELQNHGSNLWFRNIFIKELTGAEAAAGK